MADVLLIHYHPGNAQASWALVNDSGELTCKISSGELSQAVDIARQHRTVVLLDASLTHISRVDLPTQNPQKMLRAIPFALEEQLADDIEDMHFVAGKAVKGQPVPVVAINRNIMDRLLDDFSQANIRVEAVIPDALCLPANPQQWCALFHQEQAILQTDSLHGSKFDRELFDALLSAELNQTDTPPQKLLLFSLEGEDAPDAPPADNIDVAQVQYNSHPLVIFAGHYKQAASLNLLQHAYKPQKQGGISWKRWRLAASLALVWLVLSLGVTGWQLHQLKQQNAQLQADIIKIYKQAFPKSKRIVNARVQMEQKLKELKTGGSGGDGIIELMASSAPALANNKAVTLKSISFRNNRLDVSVNSKDLATLQQLNTRLNKIDGIQSEIVSSSSEQNQVKASLRIKKART